MPVTDAQVAERDVSGPLELALRIVNAAERERLTVRVLGGVAVALRCQATRRAPYQRAYRDVDVMGLASEGARIQALLEELGLEPEKRFNALHGHRRLMYHDRSGGKSVDVLLDWFEMCHRIDFRERLGLESPTLPLADLLVTKLQVVEADDKDLVDALALLVDNPVGAPPDGIDAARISALCARDWGLHKTVEIGLERLEKRADALDDADANAARTGITALRDALEATPKSARWRARARIGTRKRWYSLPEEVG